MIRGIAFVAILIGAWWLFRWLQGKSPAHRRMATNAAWIAAIGALVLLAASGKLNWVVPLIAAVAAVVMKLTRILSFLPVLRQFGHFGKARSWGAQSAAVAAMSREEAYQVLNLNPGAARSDIVAAHRKLMQKIHPDRGGSAYLAAKINTAKDILLGDPPS